MVAHLRRVAHQLLILTCRWRPRIGDAGISRSGAVRSLGASELRATDRAPPSCMEATAPPNPNGSAFPQPPLSLRALSYAVGDGILLATENLKRETTAYKRDLWPLL